MKLTVLGNCGAYPAEGRACSGYLLEDDMVKVLIDCGSGVVSRLQKYCSIKNLSAVILSHLHWDHFSDLMTLRYAVDSLLLSGQRGSLKVYVPESPGELVELIKYKDAIDIETINGDKRYKIGEINIDFFPVKHSVMCWGLVAIKGSKKILYSADTGYDENLISLAKDIDLFLCEAALREMDYNEEVGKYHMTGRQAAMIGYKAGVKRLLLTHFWPTHEPEDILKEAKQIETVDVNIALEGKTYII